MKERILFNECPLCQSDSFVELHTANCSAHDCYHPSLSPLIKWMQCNDCTHIFTEGYYSDEACQLIYSKIHPHQQLGYNIEGQRIISARMIEKVLPYANSGYWLDVGFGSGSLIFTALEYGFTPIGLDLRTENTEQLSSFGIEAYALDISDLTLPYKCNVISMADVLEHIPYPKKALQAAHRLLNNEGVLFISMPNIESLIWAAMNQSNVNTYWAEMEHYHNFGRSRLYALLNELGFEPIRYGISERYRSCMEVIAKKA